MPAVRECPKMELRICIHISGRKAYLCMIHILHESSTFAGHEVSSISINSFFFEALRSKSGCLSEKSDFSHFLGKVVQTLPAVGFRRSINKHKLNQIKNQVRSQSTKEWLRYRQFNSEAEIRVRLTKAPTMFYILLVFSLGTIK